MKTAALCTQLFLAGLFLFSCGSKDSAKDETQAVIDSLKNKVEALEREQETSSEELSKTSTIIPQSHSITKRNCLAYIIVLAVPLNIFTRKVNV